MSKTRRPRGLRESALLKVWMLSKQTQERFGTFQAFVKFKRSTRLEQNMFLAARIEPQPAVPHLRVPRTSGWRPLTSVAKAPRQTPFIPSVPMEGPITGATIHVTMADIHPEIKPALDVLKKTRNTRL